MDISDHLGLSVVLPRFKKRNNLKRNAAILGGVVSVLVAAEGYNKAVSKVVHGIKRCVTRQTSMPITSSACV